MENIFDSNRAFWFIKIVEAGNISRAAVIVNVPKAKLSRNLALLEQELGIQLVYRTTRQFKLTEAGLTFYQKAKVYIEGILAAATDLKNEGGEISGKIKITAPDDIGIQIITKIIHEFITLYPQVSVELLYTNEVIDLVKWGIDVAIRIGKLKDSTLIQKNAGHIKFILISSPRYLAKYPTLTSPEEISIHNTIGFSPKLSTWELVSKNKRKHLKLKHKYVANNFIAVRDLALLGHGLAYIPSFLCGPYLAKGELIHVLKQWGDDGPPIQVTIPHQKNISKKTRAFMDFATKKLSEQF